jgi:hypothetical protein
MNIKGKEKEKERGQGKKGLHHGAMPMGIGAIE